MASYMNSWLSSLTGAQQTMSSWAKVVESYEDIPKIFQPSFETALGTSSQFPYTVFAPSIAGYGRMTTEKLLCAANDSIYVWERYGNQVTMVEYPLTAISDLEVGEILLFSWMTISGMTKARMACSTTIEFNTASYRHFARFVDQMRPVPVAISEHEHSIEQFKFDYLAAENFKFRNYARQSLVCGEQVVRSLWQPKIQKPILSFLGTRFCRTLSLAHLTILTDKELIVIQDDERTRENRGVRYGGKWRYIALRHINQVSLRDRADDLTILSLTLSSEQQLEIIFAADQKQQAIQLRDAIDKLMG